MNAFDVDAMVIALQSQLPGEIDAFLRRFERRRRSLRAARAIGLAVLVGLIWVCAWCLLDRLIDLPGAVRLIGLISGILILITILARPMWSSIGGMDLCRVALEVERRDRRFAQRLATLTSRAFGPVPYRGSGELLAALSTRVSEQIRRRGPKRLLRARGALRPWIACAVVALVMALSVRSTWLDAPSLLARFVMPVSDRGPVTTTRLTVLPGDIAIAGGDALHISVRAARLSADQPPPILHVRSAGGTWFAQMTSPMPDGSFQSRIAPVTRDLQYFVTAGDATSPIRHVEALPHPAIESFAFDLAFPPYTGLPPARLQNADGDLAAPVGTQVTLTIHCTQPLRLASMMIGSQAMRMTSAGDRAQWQARFTVQQDAGYTIRMAGRSGAGSAFRGGMIHAIADRPPIAELAPSGTQEGATPDAIPANSILPIACRASDDYPLARVDLEVAVTHGAAVRHHTISLPPRGQRQLIEQYALNLHELSAQPGDSIEARLRVEDQAGQFDLSAPEKWSIAAARAAPQPSSGEHAAVQGPAARAPIPFEPEGYDAMLKAYFQALRSRPAADK